MPATKRRHHQVKIDSRSSSPEIKEKEDVNKLLISACVIVLSRVHPKGMTSKELSAELLGDSTLSLPSNLSSTTLSSRLNGLFRKYHGDSPEPTVDQLSILPIRRETSSDLPKRLVYTYSPPEHAEADEPATPPADEDEPVAKRPHIEERDEEAPEEITFTSPVSHTPSESGSISENDQVEPVPELERVNSDVSDLISEPSEPRNSAHNTPAPSQETETLESVLSRIPSIAGRPMNKVNLYYDALGTEALSAVLNSGPYPMEYPSWNLDFTTEFVSPESVALEDLDSFLC